MLLRYFWIAYSGAVCFLHLMCSCVPFITATTAWLCTLNVHNIVSDKIIEIYNDWN
jgi:hypothetical protein